MKALKKTGTILICIPGVLLFLFIIWELFGMAVNNVEASFKTDSLVNSISNMGDDAEILDTYTFVGNSSGTGNHCDLVSAVLVRTEQYADLNYYVKFGRIYPLSEMTEHFYAGWSKKLNFPEENANCYLVIEINSAPFADNIMGH